MRIDFMNLSRQCAEHKDEFMKVIESVYDETAFSGGKYTERFEKDFAEYIGTKYCSSVSSGTSALHLAMMALGITRGDEVIVPANTFIASAWGTVYVGAKPVFCDIDNETWEIDPKKIEEKITKNTKAIVAVHLYGQAADMDPILALAKKYGLFVVEDCAQAHGALYKNRKVGTFGDIACFSFYPGKNLGAFGEAGAVITNTKKYYELIEIMKAHGSMKRYYHDMIGFNMRMDGIQGAVLSAKLKYLDIWNNRRCKISAFYHENIKNELIKMQVVPTYTQPVYHLFEVEVDDRQRFMQYMEEKNIYCGSHYPVPCHLQNVFSNLEYSEGDIPQAEYHAKHCVSLPMYPELTDEEVEKVVMACNEYQFIDQK